MKSQFLQVPHDNPQAVVIKKREKKPFTSTLPKAIIQPIAADMLLIRDYTAIPESILFPSGFHVF